MNKFGEIKVIINSNDTKKNVQKLLTIKDVPKTAKAEKNANMLALNSIDEEDEMEIQQIRRWASGSVQMYSDGNFSVDL